MPDLGKYAAEVLFAYGATIAILAALVLATWVRSRNIRQALAAADERTRTDG